MEQNTYGNFNIKLYPELIPVYHPHQKLKGLIYYKKIISTWLIKQISTLWFHGHI